MDYCEDKVYTLCFCYCNNPVIKQESIKREKWQLTDQSISVCNCHQLPPQSTCLVPCTPLWHILAWLHPSPNTWLLNIILITVHYTRVWWPNSIERSWYRAHKLLLNTSYSIIFISEPIAYGFSSHIAFNRLISTTLSSSLSYQTHKL